MQPDIPAQKFSRPDGIELAYRLRTGNPDLPTLVFCGGYRSDMCGSKATYVDDLCARNNIPLLRFDYSGHGESGGQFADGSIGMWRDDALSIINHTVKENIILIGSSMGGWISLLLAQQLGARLKGLIGIAAAPDFTQWVWDEHISPEQRAACTKNGYITDEFGQIMTLKLFEDGKNHLVLNKSIKLLCPVTLLHGKMDAEVPWPIAQKIAAAITPTRAEIIYINDGDHRLARDNDLTALKDTILSLL